MAVISRAISPVAHPTLGAQHQRRHEHDERAPLLFAAFDEDRGWVTLVLEDLSDRGG
jgi:hypothetical protein